MNRNTQAHFANLPSVKIGRSKFNRAFTHKTTFNAGDLIPLYVDPDIVPGDTVTMKQSEIVRMMTPLAPVMDNAYMDFYWFFVPNRLVWNDFKKFMGENETAPWTMTQDIQIPQISIKGTKNNAGKQQQTIELGSVLEKMGIPISEWEESETNEINISALPPRAYCLIWNEYFRDENLQNPVNISKTSSNANIVNTQAAAWESDPDAQIVSHEYKGGLPPLKVCKAHDYFTSCLPSAQKGPAVTIPLALGENPVRYKNERGGEYTPETWEGQTAVFTASPSRNQNASGTDINSYVTTHEVQTYAYIDDEGQTQYGSPTGELVDGAVTVQPFSLYTDLTQATGATITALRQAFAIQKFYERDARGGTRYIESVLSHFGVRNPDYRLQRPEYLGGFRHYINMNQVIQSTPTANDSTPLGTTGAYSVTSNKNNDVFTKSFTEHGILMGLACVRTDHTYQQGINRSWFKKKRLDFYSPEFANLSEQAVLNQEIYAQGTDEDKEAFGYQEAWAEMRYMPDMITGEMRNNAPQSLAIWHWGDYYEEKPTLGDKWIKETKNNIQRTLAIQNHDQFEADFYFGAIYTRPLPLYSIPGLIDHH